MRDLTSVSSQQQKQFLESFDYVFTDIDGVLLHGFLGIVPGSAEGYNSLQEIGKKISCVSNNTARSTDDLHQLLVEGGYEVQKDDLLSPAHSIINHIKKLNLTKEVYVIGSPPLKAEMRDAGIKLTKDAPDRIEDTFRALFQNIQDDENVGAVVFETDLNANFIKVQKAVTYLRRPEVEFIVGAPDRKLVVNSANIVLIGPGYFADIVEDTTGRKGTHMAKPSKNFGNFLKERFKIQDPSRVLFIGDAIREDMGLATNAGFQKLLVFSGHTTKEVLENWPQPEEYKPEYYLEGIREFSNIIKNVYGK